MRYIFVFLSFAVAAFATADNPDDACKDLSDGFGCFWTQGDCNRGGKLRENRYLSVVRIPLFMKGGGNYIPVGTVWTGF
ncbi:hypothetical protein VCV18_007196 [Metarhizium anisopliae]